MRAALGVPVGLAAARAPGDPAPADDATRERVIADAARAAYDAWATP